MTRRIATERIAGIPRYAGVFGFFLLASAPAKAVYNGIAPPQKVANAAAATTVVINESEKMCSAVWIAPKVLLTAAHCLSNTKDGGLLVRKTSLRSEKIFFDPSVPIAKKERDEDEQASDLAIVYFSKANTATTVPVAKTMPLLSQPVVLLGWGAADPNAGEAKEKDLKLLYGTNTVASRPLARKLLRVAADVDRKTTDGTNASVLGGDSGSGLFDEDAAAIAGIATTGGITPDKKKLVGTYVSLHSPGAQKLFQEAKTALGADMPQAHVDAVIAGGAAPQTNSGTAQTPSPGGSLSPGGQTAPAPGPSMLPLPPRPARRDDPDFLVVDTELAKRIEDATGIKILQGIYRTLQSDAEWRPDLRLPLIAESIVDLPPYDGVERSRVGFALDHPKELWLITQSQLRYRLLDAQGKPAIFLPSSRHVVALKKGVVHFDADWRAKYRAYDKSEDIDLGVRAFVVASKAKAPKKPVVLVDPSRERVLLAHWEYQLVGPFPEDADEPGHVEIAIVDPDQISAKEPLLTLATKVTSPFFVRLGGLFRVDGAAKKLLFRPLDWNRPLLGAEREVLALGTEYEVRARGMDFTLVRKNPGGGETALLVDATGRIAQQVGRREKFSPVDAQADGALAALKLEPPAKDILGTPRPAYLYGSERVNTAVTKVLGGSRRTWAILVYEDGQRPEEVATGFVMKLANGSWDAPPALTSLERCWKLPGGFLGVVKDADRAEDMMTTVRTAFEGRRSLAFLPDFPIRRAEAADLGVTQLEIFWHHFEKCIEDGSCRVLTTMRADVYAELARKAPNILSHATAVELPKLEGKERTAVVTILRRSLEHEYGRVLSPDAYDAIAKYGAGRTSLRQSPQRDEDLFRDFFDWAEEASPRTPELSADVAQRFVNRERTGAATGRVAYDMEKIRKYLLANMVGQDSAVEKVSALLKPLGNGTQVDQKPIIFVLLGTPGVGKTRLANLIANQLTGENSNLIIDFKNFKGFDGEDVKRVFSRLRHERRGLRVVTFDDIDRGSFSDLDALRGIFDSGVFAQGTPQETSFANTVVILTANWGEKLLLTNPTIDAEFFNKLRLDIVHDDSKPNADPNPRGKVSNRVWSTLGGKMIVLAPFKEEDLFRLAIRFAGERAEQVKAAAGGKELLFHPLVLTKVVSTQRTAAAGARDIQNALDTDVYPAYEDPIAGRNVRSVILVPSGGRTVAVSDADEHFRLWKTSRENALKVIEEKGAQWFLENGDKWFAEDFKKIQGGGR